MKLQCFLLGSSAATIPAESWENVKPKETRKLRENKSNRINNSMGRNSLGYCLLSWSCALVAQRSGEIDKSQPREWKRKRPSAVILCNFISWKFFACAPLSYPVENNLMQFIWINFLGQKECREARDETARASKAEECLSSFNLKVSRAKVFRLLASRLSSEREKLFFCSKVGKQREN